MPNVDLNITINVALIIYVVTYLLVNGFLIYLLFRLGKTLRGISAYSQSINTVVSEFKELNDLKSSLFEIHRISAQELNEIDELKQSLFDIQNTTARQLNEINKLKQFISDSPTSLGATSDSGLAGVLRHSRAVP